MNLPNKDALISDNEGAVLTYAMLRAANGRPLDAETVDRFLDWVRDVRFRTAIIELVLAGLALPSFSKDESEPSFRRADDASRADIQAVGKTFPTHRS